MINIYGKNWKVYKKNKIEVNLINRQKETLTITREEYNKIIKPINIETLFKEVIN